MQVTETIVKGAQAREIMDSPIKAASMRCGFDLYQEGAMSFGVYPEKYSVIYPALKLAGEAGEVSEKVGKIIRDKDGVIGDAEKLDLAKEVGDVLWYCAAVARDLGLSLGDIAAGNFTKLIDRANRNVLSGSGDNR